MPLSMGWIMATPGRMPVAFAMLFFCLPFLARADSLVPATPSAAARGTPNGIVELDRNGDGKVDYRVIFDQGGLAAREELDFNNDGIMDTLYHYRGGVLQKVEIDSKNTGAIDIWVYLLDGTYVQRYERDTNGDGKPDLIRSFDGG